MFLGHVYKSEIVSKLKVTQKKKEKLLRIETRSISKKDLLDIVFLHCLLRFY